MLNRDIHRQLKQRKVSSSLRLIMLAGIAVMAFLMSGCVTLPSSTGSADSAFFNSGVVLSSGEEIRVLATDPLTDRIYAGGKFETVNGEAAANIAMYDPVENRWHSLSEGGLDGDVNALVFRGRDLYVGGYFLKTKDVPSVVRARIARYDTVTGVWSSLADDGVNDEVHALAFLGEDLYVGGDMDATEGHPFDRLSSNILRYNTSTNVWSAVKSGVNDRVNTIAVFQGDVFIGGRFTLAYVPNTDFGHIVKYSPATDAWVELPHGGLNEEVNTIVAGTLGIYVGGNFIGTADNMVALGLIAFLGSNNWFLVANDFDDTATSVNSLAIFDGDLYVGGKFTTAENPLGAVPAKNIVKLHNDRWFSLNGEGLERIDNGSQVNSQVNAIAVANGDLFIGGVFDQSATCPDNDPSQPPGCTRGLNGFARYGAAPASPVAEAKSGSGNTGFIPFNGGIGLNGEVRAIESGPGGMLYVGGDFTQSFDGTVGLGKIARFDPVAKKWTALDMGGLNGVVNAIAVDGNTLYVGGEFSTTA